VRVTFGSLIGKDTEVAAGVVDEILLRGPDTESEIPVINIPISIPTTKLIVLFLILVYIRS
jgi:hypothetical protein